MTQKSSSKSKTTGPFIEEWPLSEQELERELGEVIGREEILPFYVHFKPLGIIGFGLSLEKDFRRVRNANGEMIFVGVSPQMKLRTLQELCWDSAINLQIVVLRYDASSLCRLGWAPRKALKEAGKLLREPETP